MEESGLDIMTDGSSGLMEWSGRGKCAASGVSWREKVWCWIFEVEVWVGAELCVQCGASILSNRFMRVRGFQLYSMWVLDDQSWPPFLKPVLRPI